jgi:uncharacterized circularly permuted ATP-grasp superfamily protein
MLLLRLDSAFADPLELRADSALGVTGMVETTRSGALRWPTRWARAWSRRRP